MAAIKVIKVHGTSEESWQDAAESAFEEASKTVEGIREIEIVGWRAVVEDDDIVEYHATVELAFPVRQS